jgi:Flp pilus assembly protein TadD
MMLARTNRVEEGRAQLEAVLKPAEAAYNIGSVLEQTGRKDQAREEYNKALKLDPNFQQAQARLSALN